MDWDPALERLYGLPEGGFGGRFEDWVAHIHPEDRAKVLATLEETLETGEAHLVLYRTARPGGSTRWIEGRGKVVRDGTEIVGVVGACRDVTERQESEHERARMLAAERRARERLEFLAEASDLLARSLDVDDTLHELAELAVPRLGDWCAIDLGDRQSLRLSALAHTDPERVEFARELRRRFGSVLDHPATGAVQGGDGYVPEIADDLLRTVARDEEHFRALQHLQLRSAVLVPLQARTQRLGTLALVHAESGRRHSRDDYTLAVELARRASIAVDNARLFSERSRVASVLQRALLPPQLPVISGVELASHYDTADATDIGGDFYDALGAGEDWTLVIGDVRGKGVEAASLASLARHTVRAAALRDPDPGRILSVLNDALVENDPMESFCTAVCAHLQVRPGTATLDLAAGGHPPPLLLRADGSLADVDASGPLIGLLPGSEYPVERITLHTGDLLFFYTDGVTEARRGHELFGTDRLEATLLGTAGLTAGAALKQVHAAVEAFQAQQRDDVALLALRLLHDD